MDVLVSIALWIADKLIKPLTIYANSHQRRLKRLTGSTAIFRQTQHIVLSSSLSSLGKIADKVVVKRDEPYLNYWDALAFGYVYGLLSSVPINLETCFKDTPVRNTNIFCIGGPAVNTSSRRAFQLVAEFLEFKATSAGENALFDKFGDRLYTFQQDETDFGVILKVANPACKGTSYFVFAGIWGWGTAGAAYYFANNLGPLSKEFGRRDFAVILEISIPHTHSSAKRIQAMEIR